MFKDSELRNFTPIKLVVLLTMLLLGLLGFSLWTMVKETDRIDERRAKVAVSAALFGVAENMTKMVQLQAAHTLATSGNAHQTDNHDAFYAQWGAASGRGDQYDLVFQMHPDGIIHSAFERGRQSTVDYRTQMGDALQALAQNVNMNRSAASTGLIQTRRGLAIASVVRLTNNEILVVAKYVTRDLLKDIGKEQWIYGLHSGQPRDDETSIVLNDAAGDPVVTLSWRPVYPGIRALADSSWVLAAGILLFLCVATYLLQQASAIIDQLKHSAYTDSLSGLPNRRALHRDIASEHAGTDGLALAFLDLDGFKGVNDHYGHNVGDQLIIRCSEKLTGFFGGNAVVYRMGGDEFAVLIGGNKSVAEIEALCHDLLAQMSLPFQIDARTIVVGTSIGLSRRADDWMSSTELLRQADVAMYASKLAGKMQFSWFDSSFDDRKREAHRIEIGLRSALELNQFRVLYQQLVDSTGTHVVAAEALLRWEKSDGTMVGPNIFIPVAEETGLINEIGLLVLRQACSDALNWGQVQLSVNVSPVQLRNPGFPGELANILQETGFPPSRLELEVTETYLVGDPETARKTLDAIHAIGVKTALDDFGTGYASIGFLRKFAFDKLKIDRSLVCDAAQNPASRALLQASVAMARALNMAVTAEGVENQAQADLARIAGCDQLQGWLYYRALPADVVTEHLAPRSRANQLFLRDVYDMPKQAAA